MAVKAGSKTEKTKPLVLNCHAGNGSVLFVTPFRLFCSLQSMPRTGRARMNGYKHAQMKFAIAL